MKIAPILHPFSNNAAVFFRGFRLGLEQKLGQFPGGALGRVVLVG